MIKTNTRRVYFISYYVISVVLVFMLFGDVKWMKYVRLMANGTVANATVTATTCSNGMTFSYRFTVGGESFAGSGSDGYGNQPCSSLKPGDAATIFYLNSDPATNLPGDPLTRFISEFAAIALVAIFVPIILLLLLFGLLRLWRKQNSE